MDGAPGVLAFDGRERSVGVTAREVGEGEIRAIGSIADADADADKLAHLDPVGNLDRVIESQR